MPAYNIVDFEGPWTWWIVLLFLFGGGVSSYAFFREHWERRRIMSKKAAMPYYVIAGVVAVVLSTLGGIALFLKAEHDSYKSNLRTDENSSLVNCNIAQSVDRIEVVMRRVDSVNSALRMQDSTFRQYSMTSLEQMHGVLSEVQSVHTSTQRQTLLLNSTSAKTMDTLELMMTNLDQNMTSLTGLINDARLLIFPLRELRVSFVCRYKMTPDVANKFQNDVQLKVSEPFVRSLDDSFGKLTGVAMVLLRTYGGFSLTMGGGSTEILVDRTLPGKDDLMRYAVASDILYIYYNCGIDLYSGGETERLLTIEDVENAYWQLDLTTHLKSDVYPLDHSKKFNGVTYEGMLPVVCISIESNVLTEQVYGDLEVKKGKLLRTPWEGSLQAENVSAKVMPFRYTRKKLAHNRFGVPDTLIPKEFLPIRLPFYERNR